jgi:hypothetical protein
MMLSHKRGAARWIAVLVITVGLVAGVYAFTAANTVPTSKAGDGSGAISGYIVTTVHYGLNASDSSKIDSVTFNLDSTPVSGSTIKIQLVSAGSWYSCTNVAAAVTCATTSPQATVLQANNLRVVIAD